MADLPLIIGTIGMFLILVAFVCDLLKKLTPETISYNLLNIAGSGLMLFYSYSREATLFIILNSTWFLFASYKLIKILRKPKPK